LSQIDLFTTGTKVRDKLQKCHDKKIQTYFALWLIWYDYELDYIPVMLTDFTEWIMSKHREYEPDENKRRFEIYIARFTEWLIEETEKHIT